MVECVDIIVKAYKKHIEHIYVLFSGRHAKPGAKKSMELDEFEDFVECAGLMNDSFVAREISVIFNLSMLT